MTTTTHRTSFRSSFRSSFRTLAIASAALGVAGVAPGQDAAPPEQAPVVQPTRIKVDPVRASQPTLVREGAFLSGMHGELRKTSLGWVMDFAPDAATGQRLGSMVLQRGMTLTAMEQIIRAHDEPIGFIVSGQVFVYRDKNYLLPTKFAITTHEEMRRPEPDPQGSTGENAGVDPIPGFDEGDEDPSATGILDAFDDSPESAGEIPIAPSGGGAARMREGTMIAQVRGRVVPGAGGDLVFTQDNDDGADADKAGAPLPSMRLMPCLNVERLEQLRTEWGDRLVVSMSGRIFVDGGHPTLLPTMYVVELDRAGNLSLGQ